MAIYVECAEDAQGKNTGAVSQCLDGIVVKYVLAPIGMQKFDTKTLAKSLVEWKEQIADKLLIPLYDVENLAIADVDPTYEETRKEKLKITDGKKVRTFEFKLGMCSHNALTSYDGKKMQVYEITEDNELIAISKDSITVNGQTVLVEVGMYKDTVKDKKNYTPVTLSYLDFREKEQNGVKLQLPFGESDVLGVFDGELVQVSSSATSLKFKILAGCEHTPVKGLLDGDFTYKTTLGVDVAHTFVPSDSEGIYELTGTGFVAGNVLNTNGVVSTTEFAVEAVKPLITTIP